MSDPASSPQRRWRALVPAVTLLALAAPVPVRTLWLMRYLQPSSIDGKFQTFASVAVLSSGGVPFRDFPVYLGLLVTSLVRAIAGVTGRDLVGTQTASIVATNLALIVTLCLLFHLAGVARERALPAMAAVAVVLIAYPWTGPFRLMIFAQPGNSLPGLRAFAGTLAALAVFAVERIADGRRRALARPVAYGLLAGALTLWSNDFGLAAAFVLLVASFVYALRPVRLLPALLGPPAALLLAVAAQAALLALFRATPADWLEGNVRATAGAQFWLFSSWIERDKVFDVVGALGALTGLSQIRADPLIALVLFASLLVHAATVLTALLDRARDATTRAMAALSAIAVAGGFIATAGGHFEQHYWALTVLTAPFAAMLLWRRFPRPRPAAPRLVGMRDAAALAAGAVLIWAATLPLLATGRASRIVGRLVPGGGAIEPSLGAGLTAGEAAEYHAVQALGRAMARCGVPRDRRMIETYPSLMSIAVGASVAPQAQSVLTVLGDSGEAGYRRAMDARRPLLATSIAPDFTVWSDWALRGRWFWYDRLVSGYRPVARTAQHVLWLRDPARRREDVPGQCSIVADGAGRARLVARAPAGTAGRVGLVTVAYAAGAGHDGAMTPFRTLVTAEEEGGTRAPQPIPPEPRFEYGLPPGGDAVVVPFVAAGDGPATIVLASHPVGRSTIAVRSCAARYTDYRPYAPLPSVVGNAALLREVGRIACMSAR